MVRRSWRVLPISFVCLLLVLSGCGAVPSASPTDVSPAGTTTASPTPPTETPTVTPETTAPEGLLVVDFVENRSEVNESEVVAYNGTIVGEAPTLDDAIADAISTNTTQTRDLSSREVRRVEAVAEAYGVPTGGFVVSKNGTMVRVSLGYEA